MEYISYRIKDILESEFVSTIQKINEKMEAEDIVNFGAPVVLYEPEEYNVGMYSVNVAFTPSITIYNSRISYDIQEWGTAGVIRLPIVIEINIKSDSPATLEVLKDRYLIALLNILSRHPRLDIKTNDEIVESMTISNSDLKIVTHSPKNHVIYCELNVSVLTYDVYKHYGLD